MKERLIIVLKAILSPLVIICVVVLYAPIWIITGNSTVIWFDKYLSCFTISGRYQSRQKNTNGSPSTTEGSRQR